MRFDTSRLKFDFSNFGNANKYESSDTSILDLTKEMVRIIQNGDKKNAEAYVRSEPYKLYQDQVRLWPAEARTNYIFCCVAAYTSAIIAMSGFSAAERLLAMTTGTRCTSVEEYLTAMSSAIILLLRSLVSWVTAQKVTL